jgi:hypothetical protein
MALCCGVAEAEGLDEFLFSHVQLLGDDQILNSS